MKLFIYLYVKIKKNYEIFFDTYLFYYIFFKTKHMQDFLSKELIGSYDWSDFNKNRNHITRENIEGRVWFKTGKYTSTAFVGDVYKLDVSSDEPFKFVMLVGMSRQHPNERKATKKDGIDVAAINAKLEPFMVTKYVNVPTYKDFAQICESYINNLPFQFVRTREEAKNIEFEK